MAGNIDLFLRLKSANPEINLFRVTDEAFCEYGTIINADTSELMIEAKQIPMPDDGVRYLSGVPELESCGAARLLESEIFGEMPVQTGYCWGYSNRLNALEWHKCSEVNIAVTPLVLLLGKQQDIIGGRYASAGIRGFYMEPGQAVELYGTTLHYAPCQAKKEGFGCIVMLPRGTNTALEFTHGDKRLFAKNKWLLAHEGNSVLLQKGAVGGVYGENYTIMGV